ncbi:MAG: Asp-tRNA(Asn)/Glu-tRNA(Gln) amidotransferase subunit GatC [Patescibacteria group bacterium]|nr:Asp-tRNA(Asn)/Glu-tRNA(Gln) amidotransferase subunit GatC [Patescibacteria group bacterium]
MISDEDVQKLALLSRVALTPEERARMQKEMVSILAYIDTVQKVPLAGTHAPSPYLGNENVMREDADPHAPGIYTETLLSQAPRREGNYLKVRKILDEN